jgi:LytS/YehU family sensor histidine kinase
MLAAFLIRYSGGFLVSLFLRHVYRGCDYRNLTTTTLFLRLAPSFFLAVHVWFAIDMVKDTLWNDWSDFPTYYVHKLLWNSMFLMWWSLLYFGIKLWMDGQRQKEETVKAEILAQNARLQMLPYQLDPQFLFRSLDVIQSSIDESEERAKTMITDLSEFLRYSLLSRRYPVAPLRWELEAMRHYTALVSESRDEKSKLTYRIDHEADEFPVHAFTLYPVMDWAFGSDGPVHVGIEAGVNEGLLRLEISRTGQQDGTLSKDLEDLRKRLESSYPERHRLNFEEQPDRTSFVVELHPALGGAQWGNNSNP